MTVEAPGGARPVGIVCGMAMEAAALGPLPPGWRVAVSGARPDRAEAQARRLIAEGCGVLVSWGLAGGLDPRLAPGDLLLPSEVVAETGERWPLAVPEAVAAVLGALPRTLILGLDRVAMTGHEKAALAAASGAAAVDMETHRIARAAARAGVPALAIRAVSDPAARALPALAASALDAEGRPRIAAVLLGLLSRPQDLPALLRAKRDSDAALAALAGDGARAVRAILAGG